MKVYKVNKLFNCKQFAKHLNSLGIKAKAGSQKIIFDDVALRQLPKSKYSMLIFQNIDFMLSPYHTIDYKGTF